MPYTADKPPLAESPEELVTAVRSRLEGVLASLGGAR